MTNNTITPGETLNFNDLLGKTFYKKLTENFNLTDENIFIAKKLDLSEFLNASEVMGPFSESHISYEPLELAEVLEKNYLLIEPTKCWNLYLKDTISFSINPVRDESFHLTDKCSLYKSSKHEVFKIEIWRNGSTVNVDPTDLESFEFSKILSDEIGGGEIVFNNSSTLDYREGDEVRIYYGSESIGLPTLMFTGEVDSVERFWDEEESESLLKLTFLDYGKLLLERKIDLSFPLVTNVNSIIDQILSGKTTTHDPPYPNERKINTDNVDSYDKTRTVDFVGESLFDCLEKLAFITQSEFYVDKNKYLRFFPRTSRGVQATFGVDDFEEYNYQVREDLLSNTVNVYGHQNKIKPLPESEEEDPWSDSKTNWETAHGALLLENIGVRSGNYSLQNDVSGSSPLTLNLKFTFPEIIDLTPKQSYKELVFAGKIISGAPLLSFPKSSLTFELLDSDDNKVIYPGEKAFDFLKTYEADTEGGYQNDVDAHTTSLDSWVYHSTIEVVPSASDRVSLYGARDIFRHNWYGYKGWSQIEYRFGGSGTWTIIATTFSTEEEVSGGANSSGYYDEYDECLYNDTYYKSWMFNTFIPSTWGPYERFRLPSITCQLRSSGAAYAWMRFKVEKSANGIDWDFVGYYPDSNGWGEGGTGWRDKTHDLSPDLLFAPNRYLRIISENKSQPYTSSCHRWFGNNIVWRGRTHERSWEPEIVAHGGIGEKLEVRFAYKVNTAHSEDGETATVYSKNRRIQYSITSESIPENLTEVRIPIGQDEEMEGKWEKSGGTFDWSKVKAVNILTRVEWKTSVSAWARLIVDWLHFDSGKWFGKAKDNTSYADPSLGSNSYGVRFREIFDETIYSDVAAERWAVETVARYKDPIYYLKDGKGILDNIEFFEPGDQFVITLPETGGTSKPYLYFLRSLTLTYSEEDGAIVKITLEQIGEV